jgi:hypothetical protein
MHKIALITNSATNCGIHTYGLFTHEILSKSNKYNYTFVEVANVHEYAAWYNNNAMHYQGLLYNHHPSTMPWLIPEVTSQIKIPQFVITGHDVYDAFPHILHHFVCDPTFVSTATHTSTCRPLIYYDDITYSPPGDVLKIGSFGFGQWSKNFPHIVKTVSEQFTGPVIVNIQMSYGQYVDMSGNLAHQIADSCRAQAGPNVQLNITHDFIPDRYVLARFLNQNDLNIFYYATQPGRGISSCIDSGLTAMKPLAISDSNMYRHISHKQELLLDHNHITDIIARGIEPLAEFHDKWNQDNFRMDYEQIFDRYIA